MALDDILRTMEEQSAAEEERVRSQARVEAEALLADGKRRADEAYRREYDNVIAPLRAERMRIVNEARLALQSALQNRKQHIWQEVVAEARVRIEKHRGGDEYTGTLTALIDEAAGRLGVSASGSPGGGGSPGGLSAADVVVEVAAKDEQAARTAVGSSSLSGAKLSADGDIGSSLGGVSLTTADGGVRVLNTLDSRLDEVVGKEVAELATRLFGEG